MLVFSVSAGFFLLFLILTGTPFNRKFQVSGVRSWILYPAGSNAGLSDFTNGG